jgi:crossover junction endodeoxyribonuclease RusA
MRNPSLPVALVDQPPIRLTLPYPPSTNHLYATFRGRRIPSRECKEFKAAVADACLFARVRPLSGPVRVTINLYRPRRSGDLDNATKALLDSLTTFAYTDDRQVVEIHSFRHDDPKAPRVDVLVEAAN